MDGPNTLNSWQSSQLDQALVLDYMILRVDLELVQLVPVVLQICWSLPPSHRAQTTCVLMAIHLPMPSACCQRWSL